MKKVLITALIISLFGSLELLSQVKAVATVEITFRGLRNNKGIVAIGLHNSPKGWYKKPEMEPNWSKEEMINGSLSLIITVLLPRRCPKSSILYLFHTNQCLMMVGCVTLKIAVQPARVRSSCK